MVLKVLHLMPQIRVLNVYLPYQDHDNVDEHQLILGKIQAISDSFESSNIVLLLVTSTLI